MSGAKRRRTSVLVLGLLLAGLCLVHAEVIFLGHVYHMDDAADSYYPGHIAVARAFAQGELPTWEPGSWCGWPLIVDPYNGVFYPLNVLYYLFGAARGLGFSVVLHALLGGAGIWWLLGRRRGWPAEAALFGAISFAFSSFFVVRIRHIIFLQMMGWLPWILVGVEAWLAERRRSALALAAVSTGLALVAGALSIGHFAALAVAVYTLGRTLDVNRGRGAGWGEVARDLGWLGAAAGIGALLAAAQLVPTVAHLPHSPRALGSDYDFASSYAWPSLQYLLTLLMPDYFGGELRRFYVGAPNHWELCGWYVGTLTVLLAPLGLWLRPRPATDSVHTRELTPWLLGTLTLLAIALALGDAGPVHPWFFRHVPLYAALRCPPRALLMTVLVLPILGAQALAGLLLRPPLRLRRWASIGTAVLLGVGGVAAALVLWPRAGMPLAMRLGQAALAQLALVVGLGGSAVVLLVSGALGRRHAAVVLLAVLALDLVATARRYVQPQPADYPAGMERFAAIEWLARHADGHRFVNDPRGPFRLHNVGMVLGLENASGYDSVAVWRYVDLLYLMQHGRPYPEPKLKHDFAGIGVWNLSSPLLDLMDVRYLVAEHAPPDLAPDGGPRWVERFAPRPPTGAPAERYETAWDARLRVFENRTVLPRAFVVYRAEVARNDQQLAARLLTPGFDFGRVALLEAPLAPESGVAMTVVGQGSADSEEAPPHTEAVIRDRGRQRLMLEVETHAPGLLVLSEIHYPGWSAQVDGRETPIVRTNWAFRGIVLPPGRHQVVLGYRSLPTRVGIALSLLGILLLALLTLSRRRAFGAPR